MSTRFDIFFLPFVLIWLSKGEAMCREYQKTEEKDFVLPYNVYMQTIWCIRDYQRLSELEQSLAKEKVSSIDKALESIPEAYRQGIMDNILYHIKYEDIAHENTWKRWKQRFIYYAANNLGINVGGLDNEGKV